MGFLLLFIYYATKAAQENTNIQTYKTYKKHVKPYAIKLQWNYKYAATDPANACVTAHFIQSLEAVDRTPYLLHKNMKSEDVPGKHIRVLRITFLLDEITNFVFANWDE